MGKILIDDDCKGVEFEDGRRTSLKKRDLKELKSYLKKKKVREGNDERFLKNLCDFLHDYQTAKLDQKEEALLWLVEYLTVDHQDFYDKFRDNLRKKKKRAQKKKVQTRKLNVEEKMSQAGRLAHKKFPL